MLSSQRLLFCSSMVKSHHVDGEELPAGLGHAVEWMSLGRNPAALAVGLGNGSGQICGPGAQASLEARFAQLCGEGVEANSVVKALLPALDEVEVHRTIPRPEQISRKGVKT